MCSEQQIPDNLESQKDTGLRGEGRGEKGERGGGRGEGERERENGTPNGGFSRE